jgi:hypothetical protein
MVQAVSVTFSKFARNEVPALPCLVPSLSKQRVNLGLELHTAFLQDIIQMNDAARPIQG